MGKNKNKNKGNQQGNQQKTGTEEKGTVKKPMTVDASKKQLTINVISAILTKTDFPKATPEELAKIAEELKLPEKTLVASYKKLTKVYSSLARGKKEKVKKSKDVGAEMEKKIQDSAFVVANSIAEKLFDTKAIFSRMIVLKKSKKENADANGKILFKMENTGKEHFLCWDYKKGDLFVGSTLHEFIEEMTK